MGCRKGAETDRQESMFGASIDKRRGAVWCGVVWGGGGLVGAGWGGAAVAVAVAGYLWFRRRMWKSSELRVEGRVADRGACRERCVLLLVTCEQSEWRLGVLAGHALI